MTSEDREKSIRACADYATAQVVAAAENIGSEESSFEIPDPTKEEKFRVISFVIQRLSEHLTKSHQNFCIQWRKKHSSEWRVLRNKFGHIQYWPSEQRARESMPSHLAADQWGEEYCVVPASEVKR